MPCDIVASHAPDRVVAMWSFWPSATGGFCIVINIAEANIILPLVVAVSSQTSLANKRGREGSSKGEPRKREGSRAFPNLRLCSSPTGARPSASSILGVPGEHEPGNDERCRGVWTSDRPGSPVLSTPSRSAAQLARSTHRILRCRTK